MNLIIALMLTFGLLLTNTVTAATHMNKEQALELAFPAADQIETLNLFLTPEQLAQVGRTTGVQAESSLYTFYVGKRNGEVLGYAAIESSRVRTLPQTMLVVIATDGTVMRAEILAFFEPPEYQPSLRWLQQFFGVTLTPDLRIGGQIQGLTGATLSAQSVARQVRKTLAMAQLITKGP